ncbi:MAG TPA: ABC transporter substrate-binding protein [Burkholderiales bacterium]|jgi:branched-chain amino acid transport system substrate-binding protein
MSTNRRQFINGTVAAGAALGFPAIVRAQSGPIRLGMITVKTGPLASGGLDMERGLQMQLEESGNMIAGRKVELIVADSGGVPATARTKMQELTEKNKIHALIGPLAAFEALAIDDYIRAHKMPTLGVAAAEDMTQRKASPWFVRPPGSSAQGTHPMADFCLKQLKWKRAIIMADDIAFGHEQLGGFARVFEEGGGKVVQRLLPPLTVPDYGSYLAQLKTNADGIFFGFAGSNGFRFLRQFNEYGLKGKISLAGGQASLDEAVLRNMGDEALGTYTVCPYSAELDNPVNKRVVPAFRAKYKYDPGWYCMAGHVNGEVFKAAAEAVKGHVEDSAALMKALHAVAIPTMRGSVKIDEYGNVIGDMFIRQVTRKEGRLVNSVVKTYTNVSQFWTYDPKAFLKNPVYSRDWPPLKNLES